MLRIGSRLDLGLVRDNQEDNLRIYLPEQQAVQEQKGALFIVADGVGGHQAGDVASALATEVLTEAYYASPATTIEDALRDAVTAANTRITTEAAARSSQAGMGSTCVCIALRGSHIGIANVGDSRGYIIRAGQMTQLTQDHSWVAEQVRSGQLNADEARDSQYRSVLTQALGSGDYVEPSVRGQNLREGDILLLCSDGLTAMLSDEEIAAFVAQYDDPQEACDVLTDAANQRGGKDNISIIIVRVDALQGGDAPASVPAEATPDATATHIVPDTVAVTESAAIPPAERSAPVEPDRVQTAPQPTPRAALGQNVTTRAMSAAPAFAAPPPATEVVERPSRWPLALLVVAIFVILAAVYVIFHDQLSGPLNSLGRMVGLGVGQLDPILGGVGFLLLLLLIWLAVRGGGSSRAAPPAPLAPSMMNDVPMAHPQPLPMGGEQRPALMPGGEVSHIVLRYPFPGGAEYDVAAVIGAGSSAAGSCVLSAPSDLLGGVDELGTPATRGFWLTLYERASGESSVAILLSPRAHEQEWSQITARLPQDPMVRFTEIRQIRPGLRFRLEVGRLHAEVEVVECHYLVAGRQRTADHYLDYLVVDCTVAQGSLDFGFWILDFGLGLRGWTGRMRFAPTSTGIIQT